MSRKTVIKQFLNEVAGISFEVRKWAQTIEDYVKNYVAAEREKLKSQTPQTPPTQTPPTQKPPTSFSWSAPSEEVESGFTHFEDDNYQEYQTANIYADELFINSDILEDFPGIKSAVTGKLFSVTFDDEGRFFVDAVGSSFPEKFREAIDEMIEDHMVMGEAFYTDDYELVYASSYDDDYGSRYDYYMNENNRDSYDDDYAEWRRNRGNDYGYSGGYSYSYTPQPKIDKIEIDGNDFPEAYKNFNVDKWIITPSNRIEYDHWKSGYNEAGQYVVYLNMPLSSVGGSALIHEIKHAYDDWNRMRKGAPPIRAGWEIQNIYTPDFEKLVLGGSFKISPMLHPIIRYYYLGSKLEAPAYLENEYDSPVMGSYRDTAKKLMNFKASNFLDKKGNPAKGLQESWSMLIAEYDIPFFRKFKNVVDFLKYTEKYFNKRGRDILRRIDKMKYVHGKPMTTQAPPKVYTSAPVKPTTTTQPTQPTQVSTGLPKPKTNLNQVEIDKLDKQIDRLEDEWDKLNLDPEKNKMDLDEIDLIIRELLNKRNRLVRDGEVDQDLPF